MKRRIPGPHQWTCSCHPSPPSLGYRPAPLSHPLALQTLDSLFLRLLVLIDHHLSSLGHLLTHLTCTHPLHTHASAHACHPLTHLLPYLSTETLMMRVRLAWTTHPALNPFQMLVQPHVDLESLECMAEGVEAEAGAGDVLVEAGVHPLFTLHLQVEDEAVDEDEVDTCPQLDLGAEGGIPSMAP